MKKLISEFKDFIMRGNVLDMAIGVIIASAFGKITTSLVNDVFMPVIGCVIGGVDLSKFNILIKKAVVENGEVVKDAVVIGIGTFLSTVIDFIIVAAIVFAIVKLFNAFHKKKEEAPAAPPEPSNEEKLLAEIRDLLKNK